ncbi:MAG TPA: roadblock/LC7 domain-containing protein [Gemmatimonadales bacterium]|jgi:predicted regulator of Ras-like GTPase activity (Roadblock/LC7/MglB family)|nr:roadblock/LC7 domain-containing protein [Gemmatimonadales bacterium]
MSFSALLGELTRIHGVRGALVVSREDGIVVAEALMEGIDGRAVAALAASLSGRVAGLTRTLGQPEPVFWQLQASDGMLLGASGEEGLLLVLVAAAEVNAGELRLQLLRAAERAA